MTDDVNPHANRPERPPGLSLERPKDDDRIYVGDRIQLNDTWRRVHALVLEPGKTPIDAVRLVNDSQEWRGNHPVSEALKWKRKQGAPHPIAEVKDNALVIRVSNTVYNSFDELLHNPQKPWSGAVPVLKDYWKYVWVVGGAVRDILLGKDPAYVNDLDLCGNLPLGEFRRLCDDFTAGNGSTPQVNSSASGVVHVRENNSKEAFIQFAALKLGYDRSRGDGGFPWRFGSSLIADRSFRDLTINALFYAPDHGLVLDPTGNGLSHLRFKNGLAHPAPGQVQLVIPPKPDQRPRWFVLQQVARFFKALERYPNSDASEAWQWVTARASEIEGLIDHPEEGGEWKLELQARFRKEMQALVPTRKEDLAECAEAVGRFEEEASDSLRRSGVSNGDLAKRLIRFAAQCLVEEREDEELRRMAASAPRLNGSGVRFLTRTEAGLRLGAPLADFEAPHSSVLDLILGPMLTGYRHVRRRVMITDEFAVDNALVLEGPGPVLVETGDFDLPLVVDDAAFERITAADRG